MEGCFCKAGFVFERAADWRRSKCVPLEACPRPSARLALTVFAISGEGH